jgi:hypothetical protein
VRRAMVYVAMAEYKVILDGIAAFVLEVTGESGSRCMYRFPTEAAALTWIAEQASRDADAAAAGPRK